MPSPQRQLADVNTNVADSSADEGSSLHAKRVLIAVADGSEEIETASIADTLARFGAEVVLASAMPDEGTVCRMSRGMKILADKTMKEAEKENWDLIALPGGVLGARHLRESTHLISLLERHSKEGKLYGGIGASPAVVLAPTNLLKPGATCYPARILRKAIHGAVDYEVVVQGNVVTSQGPGTALEFALQLGQELYGKEKTDGIARKMLVDRYGAIGYYIGSHNHVSRSNFGNEMSSPQKGSESNETKSAKSPKKRARKDPQSKETESTNSPKKVPPQKRGKTGGAETKKASIITKKRAVSLNNETPKQKAASKTKYTPKKAESANNKNLQTITSISDVSSEKHNGVLGPQGVGDKIIYLQTSELHELPSTGDNAMEGVSNGENGLSKSDSKKPKRSPNGSISETAVFEQVLWPGVERLGWKIETGNRPGDIYYMPPGVTRHTNQGFRNRVDFFDSKPQVVQFLQSDPRWAEEDEVIRILELYNQCKALRKQLASKKKLKELTMDGLIEEVKKRQGNVADCLTRDLAE